MGRPGSVGGGPGQRMAKASLMGLQQELRSLRSMLAASEETRTALAKGTEHLAKELAEESEARAACLIRVETLKSQVLALEGEVAELRGRLEE